MDFDEREMQRMEAEGDRAQTIREETAKAEFKATVEGRKRYWVRYYDGEFYDSFSDMDTAVAQSVMIDGTWEDATGEWERKHIKT